MMIHKGSIDPIIPPYTSFLFCLYLMEVVLERIINLYALGVLNVLYDRILLSFPYSSVSKPSEVVLLSLIGDSKPVAGFPLKVPRFIWESVMIPTIEEMKQTNLSLVQISYIEGLIQKYMVLSGVYPEGL